MNSPKNASPDHPSADELSRFLVGGLPEPELERLAGHLESCQQCQRQLPAAVTADTLVSALRGPLELEPHADEPELDQSLDSLRLTLSGKFATGQAAHKTAGPQQPTTECQAAEEPSAPETDDPIFGKLPRRFGRYKVLKRLGQGGMGAVYLAHDSTLQRQVAVKVAQFQEKDGPKVVERFLREARATAGLQHEGICQVFDFGELEGIHYIAMAYVQGRPLSVLLRDGRPLEQRRAAELVRQVALALEVAHQAGVIHRDLKPANVMLDAQERPKVVDFGLARRAQDVTLTSLGVAVGTPAYMSPEQLTCKTITPASDIYSLGVILYQALTGRLPYPATSLAHLSYLIIRGNPDPPSSLRPGLDLRLEAICRKALARDVRERYGSMAELAADLDAFLTGSATAGPSSAAPHSTKVLPRRLARSWRSPRFWIAAGVLLAVAGGALVWALKALHTDPGRPSAGGEKPPDGPAGGILAPLQGWVDVRIWEPRSERRQNLGLRDEAALPLRLNDQIRVEARVNRRAYLYVVWIDAEGKALPVYPWSLGHWEERPADEKPVDHLSLPANPTESWPVESATAGMETLLLLAREEPLPRTVDLQGLLSGLPPQTMQSARAAVWFENGEVVQHEATRAPNFFNVKKIDDPVLRAQHYLHKTLGPYCAYSRAVSFAYEGKAGAP
jgi:predicted Ser/Thr protein kinase